MSEDVRNRLRQKFTACAKKLQKSKKIEERELGTRLVTKIEQLIDWYFEHKRDMTPKEFDEIMAKE